MTQPICSQSNRLKDWELRHISLWWHIEKPSKIKRLVESLQNWSAPKESYSLWHVSVPKGLLDKVQSQYDLQQVWTAFVFNAWGFQLLSRKRSEWRHELVSEVLWCVSCLQLCAGCSARMVECASGPTPAPVQRAGWVDFVRSVSSTNSVVASIPGLRKECMKSKKLDWEIETQWNDSWLTLWLSRKRKWTQFNFILKVSCSQV